MNRACRGLLVVALALLAALPGCYSFHDLLPWNWSLSDKAIPGKKPRRPAPETPPQSRRTDPQAPDQRPGIRQDAPAALAAAPRPAPHH